MADVIKGFRQFILRGNVVDLAVAVVMGAAFGALINSLVKDLLTPLIAAIFGKHDFSSLSFTINGSVFTYGAFLNALISFFSIAFAVYFFVVQPVNVLMERHKTEPEVESTTRACTECVSNIPVQARRCAFCGSPQEPLAAPAMA